jgi:diaminopimelate decarboxylase
MKPLDSTLRARLKDVVGPAVRRAVSGHVGLPPELWRLSRDHEGYLSLDGLRLESLLDRFGSPLFVVDASRLAENAAHFLRVPDGSRQGVECYYSYKTNPVPGVLSRLHAHGVGAEVISAYELWLARRLGVPGDRVVVNGPGRSPAVFRDAIELGALVHVNHREEIAAVAESARVVGKRARVGLRVVPSGGWRGQFGEPISDGSALEAFRELHGRPELEVVALQAHLGGELATRDAVRSFASEMLDFASVLRESLGLTLGILDFGGSLACPTVSRHAAGAERLNRTFAAEVPPRAPEDVLTIREYVDTLVHTVEARCARDGTRRPRIFVEPGRAMTGNAQMLLCRVTALKASGASGLVHAVLDAGVNVAEPVRNEYHQIFVAGPESASTRPFRLVGPICTPMDTLVWARRLPELARGTTLAIMDAGAYFVPFGTSFSFPRPGIAIVEDGAASLIRRAETFEDLVRCDA